MYICVYMYIYKIYITYNLTRFLYCFSSHNLYCHNKLRKDCEFYRYSWSYFYSNNHHRAQGIQGNGPKNWFTKILAVTKYTSESSLPVYSSWESRDIQVYLSPGTTDSHAFIARELFGHRRVIFQISKRGGITFTGTIFKKWIPDYFDCLMTEFIY
jgi:hypothetical protein